MSNLVPSAPEYRIEATPADAAARPPFWVPAFAGMTTPIKNGFIYGLDGRSKPGDNRREALPGSRS